jgi:hypothetical protein
MAHPYAKHSGHSKSRSRVDRIAYSGEGSNVEREAKSYKRGGKVVYSGKGSNVAYEADESTEVPGRARGGRLAKYARGGKAKKHDAQVNIAIVHSGHRDSPGAAPPAPPPAPPRPPMPPQGLPPPGMMPPGGGMPPGAGLPPQLAGAIKPPGMMKRGGHVELAGAESGVGRLIKSKEARDA